MVTLLALIPFIFVSLPLPPSTSPLPSAIVPTKPTLPHRAPSPRYSPRQTPPFQVPIPPPYEPTRNLEIPPLLCATGACLNAPVKGAFAAAYVGFEHRGEGGDGGAGGEVEGLGEGVEVLTEEFKGLVEEVVVCYSAVDFWSGWVEMGGLLRDLGLVAVVGAVCWVVVCLARGELDRG